MSSLIKTGLQQLTSFLVPRHQSITMPLRGKANNQTLRIPRKRFSPWLTKQLRVRTEDYVTNENKEFINQVIKDSYPQPSPLGAPGYVSPLRTEVIEPALDVKWDPRLQRTGLIAKKIGVIPMWLKDGTKVTSTMFQVIDLHVIKYIPPGEYQPGHTKRKADSLKTKGCLILGSESSSPTLFTKEYCGLFSESGVMPKRRIARFEISPEAALQPGTPLFAAHFKPGDYLDIRGKTIGRGFQGVMKRWGFHGMPATHGVTKTHRRPGCIGSGGQKARVMPGTKMPGHMGNRFRIARNVKVLRINTRHNIIYTLGQHIPGSTNNYVYLYDTFHYDNRRASEKPFPTYIPEAEDELPEDIYDENVHRFCDPTIEYMEEKTKK